MDKVLAQKIVELALRVSGDLDASVKWVDELAPEEAKQYRRAVGSVLTEILIGILNPLLRLHPELTPPGLKVPSGQPSCSVHGQVGFSPDKGKKDEDGN
jgi:hypothetical protein